MEEQTASERGKKEDAMAIITTITEKNNKNISSYSNQNRSIENIFLWLEKSEGKVKTLIRNR